MTANTALDALLADPLAGPVRRARVGYVGFDIPEDLLAAPGVQAAHLPWRTGAPTPDADAWLESGFPPLTRSILQSWAEGLFDHLEFVVFTRGEDPSQRLYYYACELRRRGLLGGPEPLIFDAAAIPRASSERHTLKAVRDLAVRLEVDADGLREGIITANRRRRALAALDAARTPDGPYMEKVSRAVLFGLPDDALEALTSPGGVPARRVLLTGTPPPDSRLHEAVQAVGWTVGGEAHALGLLRLGAPVDEKADDPFIAVARHAHARLRPQRGFFDRAGWITHEAGRIDADAVIFWLIEQEEALGWALPRQIAALAEAGLPVLTLQRREWEADTAAPREIADFLKGIA